MTHFEEVLKKLVEAEVAFVLIGGLAGRAHGSAYITQDVDICYDRSPENLEKIVRVLKEMDAKLRGAPEGIPFILDEKTLSMGMNFTFITRLGDLDILGEVSGIGNYKAAKGLSIAAEVFGLKIDILTLEGLIRAKKAAGRDKDILHLKEYEALRQKIIDRMKSSKT